jgi:hemerythrin-like metal-binding protein
MIYFQWTDELSVNIEEIDSQHKEFINLTNELSGAIKIGRGFDILEETLSKLIEYAEMHFATEERLMNVHGYPGLASHKKEHGELQKHLLELNRRFNTDKLILAETVLYFLEDWVVSHVKTTDMECSSFLNSKGVL